MGAGTGYVINTKSEPCGDKVVEDPDLWSNPYFKQEELECRCGCRRLPEPQLVLHLIAMRRAAGFPFVITSGFRCCTHNMRVAQTGPDGPHTTGLAADIAVQGGQAVKVLKLALEEGATGLGIDQKNAGRFLHIDFIPEDHPTIPRPMIWSY